MHRVAITGIGIISCLGNDSETVGEALRKGKSGIVIDENRIKLGFRSPLTGMIRGFDPEKYLSKKHRKTMPDLAVHAFAAVINALKMSGLDRDDIQNQDTGIV